MGNRHLYRIECLHTLGTPESERLKVTALNLFHPTASPLFQNVGVFQIGTQSPGGEEVFSRINNIGKAWTYPRRIGFMQQS